MFFFVPQCRSKGNISGGARSRQRRELLEGPGGMLPQKILKSRGLEMPFPAFSKSYFVINAYRELFTSYTVSANQCTLIV